MQEFKTIKKLKNVNMKGNAFDIFMRRYALKGDNGKPKENVNEAFYRVASFIAEAEQTKKDRKRYADLFYFFMGSKRFIPNTPTWSGAKTKLGQLAACFVLPISDDMGKESDGIFQTLRDAALIQQSGGGNGFSFSSLRPKGDIIAASNGIASGPLSFMEVYDSAFGKIAQGGTRRGANMAVLRVDHPDIFDFIKCKSEEGKIANFNISVAVTDKFMKAVQEDGDFDLINPKDKKVWRTVKAREIFNEIVKFSYQNGEPGILFLDRANRDNPVPEQYILESTNPCGEQWLGGYENCCLGHINISESVKENKIDWEHLRESVSLAVRFLDNVITQNKYIPSVPQLKEAALKNRRIGLGFMGLGDGFYKMGIRYGSRRSLELAGQITEFMRFYAMKGSIALAKERGAFPGIKESIYNPQKLKWSIPKPLFSYKENFGRPNLNWREVKKDLKKYGIRNSTQLTVAPTGTTATVFDVEGYGCEPVFALAYFRNVYQAAGGQDNLRLAYISPLFKKALEKEKLNETQKDEIIREALNKGTIKGCKSASSTIKETFVTAMDITSSGHIEMQAAIQCFVDNSLSKTCNFPKEATEGDVRNAYMKAWELGCKGLTVYVTGSRQEVVLETKETAEEKQRTLLKMEGGIRPRPSVVVGRTHKIATPVGKAFITVNRNGETGRRPFEVFVNIGKSGSDLASMAEAMGRLISGWLRSAREPNKALEEIRNQLSGIGGSMSIGFGQNRVSSLPDAVAKVLNKELLLSDGFEKVIEEKDSDVEVTVQPSLFEGASICPECNNMTLVETEGCVKCYSCSYTRC